MSEIDQEIIIREFHHDMDKGYDINDYKEIVIEVYEYDPYATEDRLTLEEFYNQKVSDEGEPFEDDLKYYEDHLEELINNPILVKDGFCGEGRHRLAVALRTNSKIRAYCF